MIFILNNKAISGTINKEKQFSQCVHFDIDNIQYKKIKKDPNRIWINLDSDTRELKMSVYPMKLISVDITKIQIIQE